LKTGLDLRYPELLTVSKEEDWEELQYPVLRAHPTFADTLADLSDLILLKIAFNLNPTNDQPEI
jgi:hypothetical protein